ncbi:MAG: cytochrome c [Acidiferrobacterales bacterium]|nr:cytochrome c [Acidiferrobacterales bacterium]
MKLGEKIMFGFAIIVVIAAVGKGYRQFTAEDRPPPKNYYEFDEVGLQGHLVYRKMGCNSCHRAMGTGEVGVAPVLDGVGTRRTREWLHQYLTDPETLVPGTAHHGNLGPDFRLLEADQRTKLAAFLSGLRANPNSPNYPIKPIVSDS